jgi:hypothetical protein
LTIFTRIPTTRVLGNPIFVSEVFSQNGLLPRRRCLKTIPLAELHDPSYARPVGNKKAGAKSPGL